MVSTRWYLGSLKGWLEGPGIQKSSGTTLPQLPKVHLPPGSWVPLKDEKLGYILLYVSKAQNGPKTLYCLVSGPENLKCEFL